LRFTAKAREFVSHRPSEKSLISAFLPAKAFELLSENRIVSSLFSEGMPELSKAEKDIDILAPIALQV
jgi:hypothetical protein